MYTAENDIIEESWLDYCGYYRFIVSKEESFALTKGQRSKRQLSKSFTVVIEPLSIRLIKPNFTVGIIFLIHFHHFIRDRLTSVISEQFEVTMLLIQNIR